MTSTNTDSDLRVIRGTQPGLLDPSQPSRLLRSPGARLSFASFDPKTALPEEIDSGSQKSTSTSSGSSLAPPKRIVIETSSKGTSFWRFVPRARLEDGAQDEGVWPRVVDICGQKVHCYQEQWEIYKLDPKYLCVVYPWPKCSTIAWLELPSQQSQTTDSDSGKRSRWSSPELGEPVGQKKPRSGSELGEDEEEVEHMVVDEFPSNKSGPSRRRDPTSREKIRKARLHRWAKNRMANENRVQDTTIPSEGSFSMRVDSDSTFPSQSTSYSVDEDVKRKSDLVSGNDSDGMSCDRSPRGHKRARVSPLDTRKGMNYNHPWHKKRLNRLRQRAYFSQESQRKIFPEPFARTFVPPEPVPEVDEDESLTSTTETQSPPTDDPPLEAGRSHEDELAESIRKMRELEKDRPIWEAERKKREARERAEEEERRVKAERRLREEEERQRQQREATERERRIAQQQEAERHAREEELRQRENRQRRQRQRWESGPWTTHRALERYRMLSDEFDVAKFTPGQSIAFHDIPWPVLHAPSRLTVEDVDWSAVETFFATVKSHMRLQDYKEFVEKSHRRFHPDRWRARKIWAAVADEIERGYLEVASNTVAQALTPIWRAAKER